MTITELKPNEVFVFGSNLAGRHGAGAARQARLDFGAEYGIGEGLTGQCYAFPTKDSNLKPLDRNGLERSICNFLGTVKEHQELTFLLTKVGCGLAGFDEHYIKSLFADYRDYLTLSNIVKPEGW